MLMVFSACLGSKIHRRRRATWERDRQVEIQSFHSDISGNPSLLPRYFPRTVLTAPPPYVDPAEGSSVATQSDLSTMELHPQTPLPFQSTPTHPAMGAILPVAMYDAEPSDLPPPFTAVSSPSLPVHTTPMPRTARQTSSLGYIEDAESASHELTTPKRPSTTAIQVVSSSRPTRILRQSRSSNLPDIDSSTTSTFPRATESRPSLPEY